MTDPSSVSGIVAILGFILILIGRIAIHGFILTGNPPAGCNRHH